MRYPGAGIVAKLRRPGYVLPDLRISSTPNRSTRHGARVQTVVVHDTEGAYAGAVSWLKDPRARASAHVVVREDGKEATQLVGWEEKAWACESFNAVSDNIEMAGFVGHFSRAQLGAVARIVAFRLHKRGLKPNHSITNGYCFHSDLGAPGGGHHDPGLSPADAKWFDSQVKYEFKRGGFRPTWGYNFGPAA